jgi:hypothetical protein
MRALMFVVIGAIGLGEARAQPAPPTETDAPETQAPSPPADLARAAELFEAANQAMTDGRYADAARDYTAAYEISRDPVVFFKIGSAHEKAGACDVAVTWYRRYLDEAKPEEKFAKLAQERIDACKPGSLQPKANVESKPEAAETKPAEPEAPAELPAAPVLATSKKKDAAWLLVGGALTFVTAGVVLAYSANSSEQDLRDLYVSNDGMPPRFDENTQKRYDDLVSEGERFEHLSWAAFGLAGGCAIAATVLFLKHEAPVTVAPLVTPKETGVSAMVRF